jgi:hypothetical protein
MPDVQSSEPPEAEAATDTADLSSPSAAEEATDTDFSDPSAAEDSTDTDLTTPSASGDAADPEPAATLACLPAISGADPVEGETGSDQCGGTQ